MSIFIKGKKVRNNELKQKIEISFNDLNEAGQRRIFLENKDLFLVDAIISNYKSIREIGRRYAYEEASNKVLNQVIKELYIEQGEYTIRYMHQIFEILDIPRFKLAYYIEIEFANSNHYILKEWLITKQHETSNEILNIILSNELDAFWENRKNLVNKIIMHPNFELTLEGKYYGFGKIEKVKSRIEELKGKK